MEDNSNQNINSITESFSNRGPDDFGSWNDPNVNFILGFRRLAILDLSMNGHQPMISNNKEYAMVFNGEIYNFLELKHQINNNESNISWKGTSDSEILLKCFELWGIDKTLKKIDGMFAIGLWNIFEKKLYLIKDRFGEKPLYYFYNNKKFFFSSDLSVFKKMNLQLTIDEKSMNLFFKYNYIPAPYSIFNECKKIENSSYLIIDHNLSISKKNIYFENQNQNHQLKNNSISENTNLLDKLMNKSVKNRMISDAKIGSFLSSGIDSSLVTALMTNNSSKKIETFSIGFNNPDYDESKDSKKISNLLGCSHNELILNSQNIKDFIPNMSNIFSEPFADSSQIPTFFVSKFSSNKIKVALTGDGADELFGGYNRYIYTNNFYKKFSFIPLKLKILIIKIIKLIYKNNSKYLIKLINIIYSNSKNINYENIERLEIIIGTNSLDQLYENFINNNYNINSDHKIEINNSIKNILITNQLNDAEKIMIYDILNYLPNDILVKTDRTSMYNSVECRTPYLSKEIFDFSQNIPFNQKILNQQGKYILRNLLSKYLPKNLISNQKKGFSIPLDRWIKEDLLDWSEQSFNKENLENISNVNSSFNPSELLIKWNEHKNNKKNWGKYLWSVLVFINWYNYYR